MKEQIIKLLSVLWRGREPTAPEIDSLDFVRSFQRKECIRFQPVLDDVCHCGLEESQHIKPSFLESTEPWSDKECIREFPTNAYGSISFKNEAVGICLPVQYLRLSENSQIAYTEGRKLPEVLRLLEDCWNLKEPARPKMVISITGDTQDTNIDGYKKEKFMCGLTKAVKSTNAWLLTDGMDVGYTRLVGKTVSKAQSLVEVGGQTVVEIKCIGVVPYGLISNSGSFVNREQQPNKFIYDPDPNITPGLNGNHTHLLLVDNGFKKEKANADNFRSCLLDSIQEKTPKGLGIPAVVLVLDGGASAIQECLMALRRNTPVVVVSGTGRAADLLAYAITRFSLPMIHNGKVCVIQCLGDDERKDILEQVPEYLPELKPDTSKCVECANAVANCCERGDFITVYNINSECTMDKYILYALLTGRSDPIGQLELALQWNRVDVAKEKIVPKIDLSGVVVGQLNHIMTNAILDQNEDFIELLRQNGMDIFKYLTVDTLQDLYSSSKAGSHLRRLLKKSGNEDINLNDVHLLLQRLIGINEVPATVSPFEDPYLELLLWSVMSGRGQLGVYFWKKCMSPLWAAIITTCLYRSLKDSLSTKHTKQKMEYKKMRNIFEDKAVELLDNCYRDDRVKTQNLLELKNSRWGEFHLMDLALMARDMRFISTDCCQESVSQRWKTIKWKFWCRSLYRFIIMFLHFYLVLVHLVYSPTMLELLLVVLVISDAIEKAIEALCTKSLKLWLSAWNIYDIFSHVVFLTGFICRLRPVTFYMGRILYGICAMIFCCRMFRLYSIHSRLGPMILIFIYMLPNLLDFLAFLAVLLMGYGITSVALMHHPCETWQTFQNSSDYLKFAERIIISPYWQMFGDLALDEIDNQNWETCQNWTWDWNWGSSCETCVPGPESPECICQTSNEEEHVATKLMLAFFLVIGNILLLNLVIAVFTNVFQHVQEMSSEHWKFEMYRLILDYERRPPLPPPFGPFIYIFRICKGNFSPKMGTPKKNGMDSMLMSFEQQHVLIEPSTRNSIRLEDNLKELLERFQHVEDNQGLIMSRIDALQQDITRIDGTFSEDFIMNMKRFMASFEKLQNLPGKVNLLEEHLKSSQQRLEEGQHKQGQDIKDIKDMITSLAGSPTQ